MQPDGLTISVIIPLYNGAEYIEEALASVFKQIRPADEVIVVDDGSTDDGVAVVERLAVMNAITLLRKRNGGQSSARNFGIARSKGQLIALLDQDDAWYANHLEELAQPFRHQHFPDLGWVYSDLDEVNQSGEMITRSCLRGARHVIHPKRDLIHCLATDMFILPSASLISRSAFDAVGGFDERLIGFEDDDLFIRMFTKGYNNIFLEQSLTRWRIYKGSASTSKRMNVSRAIYIRKLLENYPDDPERRRFYARDLLTPRFFPWLVRVYELALRSGQTEAILDAVENMNILLPMQPFRKRLYLRLLGPFLRAPGFSARLVHIGKLAHLVLTKLFGLR